MSIINALLSEEFKSFIADFNLTGKHEIKTGHLPTDYESNLTSILNQFFKFRWCGENGNTASTDALTHYDTVVEIKGSNQIGSQQLNSTVFCTHTTFLELPKIAQLLMPEKEGYKFPKEYLFVCKNSKTFILVDPSIIDSASETASDGTKEFLGFVQLACSNPEGKNNKIVQGFLYDNKHTLKSKDKNSVLNIRLRAMYSFKLKEFLQSYNISKDLIDEACSIVFVNNKNLNRIDLTKYTNAINYTNNNLTILISKK